MDLNNLVTQENSDSGVWFPVVLYGKPADFDLLILGDDSDAVQQFSRKKMKKLKTLVANDQKSKEFDDDTIDELVESDEEGVVARIAGIRGWKVERKGKKEVNREPEPVTINGVELKNDKESYKLLVSKIPAVKEFVLDKARDRTNFLSEPSGN